MRSIGHAVLAGALLTATANAARSQQGVIPSHPALQDRFYFAAGAFLPRSTTSVQVNSNTLGVGTDVEFEHSLGMQESKTVPDLYGRYRFGNRWRVEAEYFELNRNGQRTIDRDIQYGDKVFPVNAQVSSKFDFADVRISVGYSFFRTVDKEIGVGLGAHVASYDVSLTANALGTEAKNVTAPLPVVTGYGQFALTERWAVGARLDWLSLSYDKYEGKIAAMGLDVLYQPFRHVGFGAGFRSLYIDAKVKNTDRTAQFRQTLQGPLAFVNVSF